MMPSAKDSALSPWKAFFYACRTAVRTESGMNVSEFIFPLLVLDRICFGTSDELKFIHQEFLEVLNMQSPVVMDSAERQRAANIIFMTVDTLRVWSEREVEERSKGRPSAPSGSRTRREEFVKVQTSNGMQSWQAEESIEKIGDFLRSLPLRLQAEAAASIGMNARALRYLELIARQQHVIQVFEKSTEERSHDDAINCSRPTFHFLAPIHENVDVIKNVLYRLDDFETMAAIGKESVFFDPLQQMKDSIREKEASDDYESAIQEYERALQLPGKEEHDHVLEKGSLFCLLELGRYESVINQVLGLRMKELHNGKHRYMQDVTSFAVEAAWKLGRWETLSDLLEDEKQRGSSKITKDRGTYQLFVGNAMLGLKEERPDAVVSAIRSAREIVMERLSIVAAESYARSYSDITKLHCLRELENASELFHSKNRTDMASLNHICHSISMDGWSWEKRGDMVASSAISAISSSRVALARLYNEPILVGSLFLNSGRRARKNKRITTAENLLCEAQAAAARIPTDQPNSSKELSRLIYLSQMQLAKLKREAGENAVALRILAQDSVEGAVKEMLASPGTHIVRDVAIRHEKELVTVLTGVSGSIQEDHEQLTERFAERLLQVTRWVSEIGLKGGSDIITRLELVLELAPMWEKGMLPSEICCSLWILTNSGHVILQAIFILGSMPMQFSKLG